jgi:glucose-1-phosphate thymidylyltransferase
MVQFTLHNGAVRQPESMKAIIPTAGLGVRLRPHTYTQPKGLLHVAGKPMLAHIIDELVAVGVDEIIFVVGYLGDKIEAWARAQYGHLHLHFVVQSQTLGNGHAVYMAREYLDGVPALVIFGDTIIKGDLTGLLHSTRSMAGVKEVEDPRRLGVVELDGTGNIRRIIEKPQTPPSHMAVIGAYFIKNTSVLRAALERLVREDRRMRGEFWLADALQLMVDSGERMGTFPIEHWYDCGTIDALLQANRDLLQLAPPPIPAALASQVLAPAYVSPSAVLEGSVVGPHASIGDGARILHSVVKDSIINARTLLEGVRLEQSVVGEDAVIRKVRGKISVGDATVIDQT